MKKTFCFIGGDRRMSVAASLLAGDGNITVGYANDMAKPDESLHNLLSKSQFAVLPLPYSKDGETVWTPCSGDMVLLEEVLSAGIPVLAGQTGGRQGMTDYFDEELQAKNAVLTAEAAMAIAACQMRKAFCDASCTVIGSGRIAKALSVRLLMAGSSVTAVGRNAFALAEMSTFGVRTLPMSEIDYALSVCDVIFATVPANILTIQNVKSVRYGVPFIELASPPYCISKQDAASALLTVTYASGLPGKHYPLSAGKAVYQSIKKVSV